MSRDPFRQYVPGQPFDPNAAQLNAWTAAARAHAQNGRDSDVTLPRSGVPFIRNETGEALSRFCILGVSDDGVIVDAEPEDTSGEFFDNFVFRGEDPDPDKHEAGQIAIIQRAANNNGIVQCVMSGLSPVTVEVPDDGTYRAAELIKDDPTKLMAADGGAIPLAYPVSGVGEKWAVANLGGGGSTNVMLAKTTADHPKEVAQLITEYGGTYFSETSTGRQVYGGHRGDTIASGTLVLAVLLPHGRSQDVDTGTTTIKADIWEISPLECGFAAPSS